MMDFLAGFLACYLFAAALEARGMNCFNRTYPEPIEGFELVILALCWPYFAWRNGDPD